MTAMQVRTQLYIDALAAYEVQLQDARRTARDRRTADALTHKLEEVRQERVRLESL